MRHCKSRAKGVGLRQGRSAPIDEDIWNQKILGLMQDGDVAALLDACPAYAQKAKVDVGFKHRAFILGAIGGTFTRATVHAYGAGVVLVEFQL